MTWVPCGAPATERWAERDGVVRVACWIWLRNKLKPLLQPLSDHSTPRSQQLRSPPREVQA